MGINYLHYVIEKAYKRQIHHMNLEQNWNWMDTNCPLYPSSLLEKKNAFDLLGQSGN